MEFLAHSVQRHGIQSVIGLDASFVRTIRASDLRDFVSDNCGVDIGFTAGDETFSSMIALKLFAGGKGARSIIRTSMHVVEKYGRPFQGRYYFFCDKNGFAADTDCTSVAAAALYEAGRITREELLLSAREMLRAAAPKSVDERDNLDSETGKTNGALREGVVMVYWEDGEEPDVKPRGKKQDAAVAANVIYTLLLAQQDAGLEDPNGVIEKTWQYIVDHLRSGEYLNGTRYYPSPDTFLYYVSYVCRRFPTRKAAILEDLRAAIRERSLAPAKPGQADDPVSALNVAQRILAAQNLGMVEDIDFQLNELRDMQRHDGSWAAAPYYSLGKRALYFGSAAVTTLFAARALAGSKTNGQ